MYIFMLLGSRFLCTVGHLLVQFFFLLENYILKYLMIILKKYQT